MADSTKTPPPGRLSDLYPSTATTAFFLLGAMNQSTAEFFQRIDAATTAKSASIPTDVRAAIERYRFDFEDLRGKVMACAYGKDATVVVIREALAAFGHDAGCATKSDDGCTCWRSIVGTALKPKREKPHG